MAVEFLLEKGAKADGMSSEHHATPFHTAVIMRMHKIVECMLRRQAEIGMASELATVHYPLGLGLDGWVEQPLFYAIRNNDLKMVELLLLFGANPFLRQAKLSYRAHIGMDFRNPLPYSLRFYSPMTAAFTVFYMFGYSELVDILMAQLPKPTDNNFDYDLHVKFHYDFLVAAVIKWSEVPNRFSVFPLLWRFVELARTTSAGLPVIDYFIKSEIETGPEDRKNRLSQQLNFANRLAILKFVENYFGVTKPSFGVVEERLSTSLNRAAISHYFGNEDLLRDMLAYLPFDRNDDLVPRFIIECHGCGSTNHIALNCEVSSLHPDYNSSLPDIPWKSTDIGQRYAEVGQTRVHPSL